MSVKGFKVGTEASEQYDYNFLDNKPDLSVYATKTEVAAVDDQALAAYPTDAATGAIASFPDGADGIPMKSVLCTINPLQDLHGYDAPWPSGGGINAMPCPTASTVTENGVTITTDGNGRFSISGQNTSGSYMDIVFSLTAFTIPSFEHSYFYLFNSKAESDLAFVFKNDETAVENWALSVQNRVSEYNAMKGATCNALVFRFAPTFNDTLTLSPMICDSGTETAFVPYSNICPISGFTGLAAYRTGKNLLDPSAQTEDVSTRKRWYWTDGFLLEANKSYTFTEFHDGAGDVTVYFMPMDSVDPLAYASHTVTYTPTADVYVRFQAFRSDGISAGTVYQLEVCSTASAYAPYTGNTYPISWQSEAGTVYGGTLDVVSGLLTADRILQTVDQNSGVARLDDNRCWIAISQSSYTNTDPASADGHIISDRFRNVSNNKTVATPGIPGVLIRANGSHQAVISMRGTEVNLITTEDWNVWLSSNPVQLVYELATPQTYQLTPQDVDSLLGDNNVWHDANGNTTANYRADVTLYITKKIAEATA